MSAARKFQHQKSKNDNNINAKKHSWIKKILIGLKIYLITISGVAAIGIIAILLTGVIAKGEKIKFENYLHDKYGQTFVVENIRETGASLGGKGSWSADAHPKSDPTLKFEIHKSRNTGKVDYETFLQTLWTRQGSQEVETFLASELPSNEGYFLRITPGNSPGNILYDSIQGGTPNLNDILKDHKDNVSYELSVNDAARNATDEPSESSLQKAMRVAEFVKLKGVGIPSMSYGYRDISFTERASSNQQKYQYRIKLERKAFNDIATFIDLKRHFELIKH